MFMIFQTQFLTMEKKIVLFNFLEMLSPILYRKLIVVTKSNYFEADLINNFIIKK